MSAAVSTSRRWVWHEYLKFSVYALLCVNVGLFFWEEWTASSYLFSGSVPLPELVSVFAASIDTGAWVVLLLMFELETYQIPDQKLTPRVVYSLHGLRALCYAGIVYAFYGYLTKALALNGFVPLPVSDLCSLAGQGYSLLLDLDEYVPLQAANCASLSTGDTLFALTDARIAAEAAVLSDTRWLAWTDVINSATWILVVAVLELDVRLQEHHRLRGYWVAFSAAAKFLLYGVLLAAALYWGYASALLDFWDAFLWLGAFVFIELNIFEWHDERQQLVAAQDAT